jgi:hypothetical protein
MESSKLKGFFVPLSLVALSYLCNGCNQETKYEPKESNILGKVVSGVSERRTNEGYFIDVQQEDGTLYKVSRQGKEMQEMLEIMKEKGWKYGNSIDDVLSEFDARVNQGDTVEIKVTKRPDGTYKFNHIVIHK